MKASLRHGHCTKVRVPLINANMTSANKIYIIVYNGQLIELCLEWIKLDILMQTMRYKYSLDSAFQDEDTS